MAAPMATHVEVRDEIKQAFWRIIQAGQPYWASYFTSESKPRGTNDKKFSTGHVDKKGKDRTHRAGVPWLYTPDKVDANKLCFGPWSIGEDGTRHWIALDVEPVDGPHTKDKQPTPAHVAKVAKWARGAYRAWMKLADQEPGIVCVALVQTSDTNYHLWALLDAPVEERDHDWLLDRFYKLHPLPTPNDVLDKDTARSKAGKGDHFRAPWVWQNGRQSQAVAFWVRDERRFIELGESLRPASLRSARFPTVKKADDPIGHLTQLTIANWPLKLRNGKGTRDKQRSALIFSLLGRGIEPDVVKEVGRRWLDHYRQGADGKDYYEADYEAAVQDFDDCVDNGLGNPKLLDKKKAGDYLEEARRIQLTGREEELLQGVLSFLNRGRITPPDTVSWTDTDRLVLEALIVITRMELAKKGSAGRVRFTQSNLKEILAVRGKQTLQAQHLSSKYMPRFIDRGRKGEEQKLHLLTRTLVGQPGFASEYELTPAFWELLGESPPQPLAEEGPPEAEDGAGSVQVGPEAAPTEKTRRKPRKTARKEPEPAVVEFTQEGTAPEERIDDCLAAIDSRGKRLRLAG
jgi:hypothetical protein